VVSFTLRPLYTWRKNPSHLGRPQYQSRPFGEKTNTSLRNSIYYGFKFIVHICCLRPENDFSWKLPERDQRLFKHNIFIQKLNNFFGKSQNPSAIRRLVGKALWMISVSRNSIVVIIGMILAYVLAGKGHIPFKITGMSSTIFLLIFLHWSRSVLRVITRVI
jgi:hypothetical protein